MTSDNTNNATGPEPGPAQSALPPPRRGRPRGLVTAGIIVAVLAVGAVGGAGANRFMQRMRPHAVMLLQPAPIAHLKDRSPVAVKGQVAEVFGNKFIVQDDSGRALVDTGPRGEDGKPVTKGEAITVQGHFDRGVIHANVMTRADGTSEAFGPPGPPHHHRGPGPRGDRGPGQGPDGGPPPPR